MTRRDADQEVDLDDLDSPSPHGTSASTDGRRANQGNYAEILKRMENARIGAMWGHHSGERFRNWSQERLRKMRKNRQDL